MISLGDVTIRLCDGGFGTIEAMRRMLGRPVVGTITTPELNAALSADSSPPVLVDVRSDAEQAVSRIPGAISQQEYEAGDSSHSNQRVVVYCTVGGRSYLYARKLVAAGIDAKNYRDGILGWCRAGLTLESPGNEATHAVHPYWRIFRVPAQYDVRT